MHVKGFLLSVKSKFLLNGDIHPTDEEEITLTAAGHVRTDPAASNCVKNCIPFV